VVCPMCSDLKPAVELRVECFYNGGTRTACITMGEPDTVAAPNASEGTEGEEAAPEEEEDATPEGKHERLVASTIKSLNEVVGPALLGVHAASTRECDDVLDNLPSAPTILSSLALAEAGACMKDEPLYLFVAKAVDALLKQGQIALGGGHLVEAPSADQLLNEEEKPAPAAPEAEPAGDEEGEGEGEGEKAFVPSGIAVKLPCVMLPAFSCGPAVHAESKVRMKRFWLMTRRDESLKDAVPKIIKAYNQLKQNMEEKAASGAAPEAGGEEGAPPQFAVRDDDGFFLVPLAENVQEILKYIEDAVSGAGLAYGEDVWVCCNMGADSYFASNTLEVGSYSYKPFGDEEGAPAPLRGQLACGQPERRACLALPCRGQRQARLGLRWQARQGRARQARRWQQPPPRLSWLRRPLACARHMWRRSGPGACMPR